MNDDPLQRLILAVKAVAAAYTPGRAAVRVRVDFDSGPPLVTPVMPPSKADTPAEDDAPPRTFKIVNDILQVLGDVKAPLTKTRLLTEMAQRGMEWSDRHLGEWLARLTEDGTISNPKDARRPGYCLPEHDQRV